MELLGAVKARNVTPAVQVIRFIGCNCRLFSRGLWSCCRYDDGFWNMGRRGVFTMLAQLSPIAGDSPSRETPVLERCERKAGLPEKPKRAGDCGWEDLGSMEIYCVDELSRSATWPSELTLVHVLRSPAL